MMTSKHLVALASVGLLASPLAAADRPPRDLKLVGDHWTAWDPPTDIPEGSEVHIIVPGDTLWDLAAKHSGDPYLWPQLWEKNRYILDAHWIYPGDPLVLSLAVAAGEAVGDGDGTLDLDGSGSGVDESAAATEDPLRLGTDARPPAPLGTEDDIYCSGFIAPEDLTFERSVIGSEHDNLHPELVQSGSSLFSTNQTTRFDLATGDIIYVDGGRAAGLAPGDLFVATADAGTVDHPVTRERIGRLWSYLGRVRILTVQEDVAIAEIVHACAPIRVGHLLKPFVPEPVPLGRRTQGRPANYPAANERLEGAPIILLGKDRIVSLGQDHVIWIDRGADDDVAPGDIFSIHRPGPPGRPAIVLGEVAVLSVQPKTAVAKIIESRYSVFVGDRLVLK